MAERNEITAEPPPSVATTPARRRRIEWLYAVAARAIRARAACPACDARCCKDQWCALAVDHARTVWDVALPSREDDTVLAQASRGIRPDGTAEEWKGQAMLEIGNRPPRFLDGAGRCTVAPHLRPVCALFVCRVPVGTWGWPEIHWWRRYGALRRALARAEAAAGLNTYSAGINPSLHGYFPPTFRYFDGYAVEEQADRTSASIIRRPLDSQRSCA